MNYPAEVLARFDAPPNAAPLAAGAGRMLHGEAGSLTAGARISFDLRVDQQRIVAAAFRAWGCPHTIAACSLTAERLTGAEVRALRDFSPTSLVPELAVPAEKRGRLLIVEDALRSCWLAWENRRSTLSSASRSEP